VRADYTADLTSKWQEHAMRKTVEAKNLVFDPTQQADPVSCVNIFLGWPLMPKANAELVKPILALLESLCGAEDNVEECVIWILSWLAYPLQHPGAKMQTALLMFGEKQGTGKSLLFQDVIAPIYGDYGTVASQHQLDSSFTAWRSRRLFVLFEEVLSRDDKYSHNGTLKYMITGSAMSINQKNLPERTERNHLNTVFLSNEPQPIPIELEDRRFMVIEARAKQPQEFYDAVTASIAAGGVQAFYQFLLDFPLEDFNAHTKPMMTLAKERVIEFGLNGWMSFHRSWKDGYLSAPYCSCLSEDLYTIYRRWCDKSGEKSLTLCKFSGLISSREHKVKRAVMVDKKGKSTRMIFEVKQEGETDAVDQQIERFRDLGDIRGTGAQG
jgi:putative DNA primase/helicase